VGRIDGCRGLQRKEQFSLGWMVLSEKGAAGGISVKERSIRHGASQLLRPLFFGEQNEGLSMI